MVLNSSRALDGLLDNAFWGDRSLGLLTIGRDENIKRFNQTEIESQLARYYNPSNSYIVAIGNLNEEILIDFVDKYFQDWKDNQSLNSEYVVITEPRLVGLPTGGDRVDLRIGYLGVPLNSPARFPIELTADILGGGLKSRLFQRLREQEKLAYLVHAYAVTYSLGGYLAFRINCGREGVSRVFQVIKEEIDSLINAGVSEAELERVKASRRTAILGLLENSPKHLQLLGRRSILQQDFYVDLEIGNLNKVQPTDILSCCEALFVEDNVAIVALGPTTEDLLKLV